MTLSDEIRIEAEELGREWGAEEVECYRDQNPGRVLPGWTMGTYNGRLPGVTSRYEQYELADAVDLVIDRAARDVWNDEAGR